MEGATEKGRGLLILQDERRALGRRIQDQRKRRGMPIAEFARRVGVSRPTIYAIEAGTARPPDIWTLRRIAGVLDVEVGELTAGIAENAD